VYVPYAGHALGDTPSYVVPAHALRHGSYSTPLGAVDVTGLRIPHDARVALERQTYRPPGYPALLAALGGADNGEEGTSVDAVIGAQAFLSGATVLLLALIGRRLWGERAGLLVATVYALDPFSKHYVTRILSEVLAGFLLVAATYAFVRAWQARSAAWWAAAGVLTAALTLTRAVYVLAVPLLLLAALVAKADRARAAAACLAGSALLLGPWLAWNTAATGKVTVASFGEGWNLLLAAHGEGLHRTAVEVERSAAFRRDFFSVHRLAPPAADLRRDPEAHPRYLARADAEQRRIARRVYRDRILHEPDDVAFEIAYRAYFLWMVHEDWRQPPGIRLLALRTFDWTVLVLAGLGIAVELARGGATRALAAFVVLFTLMSALHHVEARYAISMRSLYLAFAVVGVLSLRERLAGLRRRSSRPEFG
jgi:hypothetical protein